MLYEINKNQNNNFFLGEPSFKSEDNKTIIEIPVKSTYDVKNDQGFRSHLMVSNFVVPNFNGQFEAIINNINVSVDSKATSIFDLTEEKDSNEAIELLKKVL